MRPVCQPTSTWYSPLGSSLPFLFAKTGNVKNDRSKFLSYPSIMMELERRIDQLRRLVGFNPLEEPYALFSFSMLTSLVLKIGEYWKVLGNNRVGSVIFHQDTRRCIGHNDRALAGHSSR